MNETVSSSGTVTNSSCIIQCPTGSFPPKKSCLTFEVVPFANLHLKHTLVKGILHRLALKRILRRVEAHRVPPYLQASGRHTVLLRRPARIDPHSLRCLVLLAEARTPATVLLTLVPLLRFRRVVQLLQIGVCTVVSEDRGLHGTF